MSWKRFSGISFEEQKTYQMPEAVFPKAIEWLKGFSENKQVVIWSDNPAFDWQFWNYYCHRFAVENPAGFSARRIGDLDAGRQGKPFDTSSWKNYRKTAHTHNPLDDALGNAEALRWILGKMGETF